jgi:hypothetical protein
MSGFCLRGPFFFWLIGCVHIASLFLPTVCAWDDWSKFNIGGTGISPEPRDGHSASIWGDKMIVFGGRSNDEYKYHLPRTYDVGEQRGVFGVKSYFSLPVNEGCDEREGVQFEGNKSGVCRQVGTVRIGKFFNDVWMYNLGCDRQYDTPCNSEGWVNLHPGGLYGDCIIVNFEEICQLPQERYGHMATVHDDKLWIYGGFAMFCLDYCIDMWTFDLKTLSWAIMEDYDSVSPHPHKRWRQSSVNVGGWWYMFGGYRLWHGFRSVNSIENEWGSYDLDCTPENWDICNPNGGYMDDLWIFEICHEADCSNHLVTLWRRLFQQYTYVKDPGIAWDDRNRVKLSSEWPDGRAGAAMTSTNCNETYREKDCNIWLFGGYRVLFPYPETTSPGYLLATKGLSSGRGYVSYPTLPYYLNDLWHLEVDTGLWRLIDISSPSKPPGRHLHTMLGVGNILMMFGGYSSNNYYSDLWSFNSTTNYWLEKKQHVHEKYPTSCVADSAGQTSVFGVPTRASSVTPIRGSDNNTDGRHGRASAPVLIYQKRKRNPGWDGCRDRQDGKLLSDGFKQELLYDQPYGRGGHASIYHAKFRSMFVFAGVGYEDYVHSQLGSTIPFQRVNKMWHWKQDACPNNCTGQGTCSYGYCTCFNGFYGVDCSNISCPGDFCYYDENTHEQICAHCCAASTFERYDGDFYSPLEQKVPCSKTETGERHGICDGNGNCQCMQPFITDDCSVRDCPNDCSGHGWCSVEFPVSRCMCDLPYVGEDCAYLKCLNNCSYPNGECFEGTCVCNQTFSPYNKTFVFEGLKNWDEAEVPRWMSGMRDNEPARLLPRTESGKWESWVGDYAGEDCSYVVVFALGGRLPAPWWLLNNMFWSLVFLFELVRP